MSAAKRQEPAAVHAARSHGDRLSVELVEAWDDLQRRLELAEGCILVRHWNDYEEATRDLSPLGGGPHPKIIYPGTSVIAPGLSIQVPLA